MQHTDTIIHESRRLRNPDRHHLSNDFRYFVPNGFCGFCAELLEYNYSAKLGKEEMSWRWTSFC